MNPQLLSYIGSCKKIKGSLAPVTENTPTAFPYTSSRPACEGPVTFLHASIRHVVEGNVASPTHYRCLLVKELLHMTAHLPGLLHKELL